jgi:hypothetical protein
MSDAREINDITSKTKKDLLARQHQRNGQVSMWTLQCNNVDRVLHVQFPSSLCRLGCNFPVDFVLKERKDLQWITMLQKGLCVEFRN